MLKVQKSASYIIKIGCVYVVYVYIQHWFVILNVWPLFVALVKLYSYEY
jgi:hypothetical protein